MLTLPTTTEILILWDQVAKLGWPMLFVIGLLREWWVIKPHYDMLTSRIHEQSKQLEGSAAISERAATVAEESHELARQALSQMSVLAHQLELTQQALQELRLELARRQDR